MNVFLLLNINYFFDLKEVKIFLRFEGRQLGIFCRDSIVMTITPSRVSSPQTFADTCVTSWTPRSQACVCWVEPKGWLLSKTQIQRYKLIRTGFATSSANKYNE